MKLGDFRALTFDCYGTLIDWEAGILAGLFLASIGTLAWRVKSLDRLK